MKYSQLFIKTKREAPKDEISKNAILLYRAGYIHKELSGVYSFLPLGLRVLENVCEIIRKEMDTLGAQELLLTTLQDKKVWEVSGRWSDDVVDNWFKTELKNGSDLGLGFTHEEPITKMLKEYISSFRDLPCVFYQIQTKFRNEARAKSGIMRGREFLMKDMYSFFADVDSHNKFYTDAMEAYKRVFKNVGLGEITYLTFASGGSFSKYSHEFQTITDAGEDEIYVDTEKNIAINAEVMSDEVVNDLNIKKDNLIKKKAVEVGNIFSLGTRFSDAFELNYLTQKGERKPVIMGSYGIGPSRLMGVIAEVFSDEKGLVWPDSVSPFDFVLIPIFDKEGKVKQKTEEVYNKLIAFGKKVLLDDRDIRPGEKFADADLIGIPKRVVISEKTLLSEKLELKDRKSGNEESMPILEFLTKIGIC